MDNTNLTDNLIRTNQTILCTALFNNGPRLTPTGKISHAKTRVYTQRYRKEWELMPDFRGWLTSVPDQETRAWCTYCKKNLHAHRLSLLKHTCTMKHQRAALSHENGLSAHQGADMRIVEIPVAGRYEQEIDSDAVAAKEGDQECDDDNEDFEYVVETLEMEDDELNEAQCKEEHIENTEDSDDESNVNTSIDDSEQTPVHKKIKIERQDDDCHDALTKAMAAVHGEYLEPGDDHANEIGMEAGEDEANQEPENETSMISIEEDPDESQNHVENSKNSSVDGDSSEAASELENSPARRLQRIGKSFNSSKNVLNTVKLGIIDGQPAYGTPVSIPSGQTKTIKLNSGKTVTLRGGTQYVLSNLKANNIPGLLITESKQGAQSELTMKSAHPRPRSSTQKFNPYSGRPGSSKQTVNQRTTKSEGTKRSCISTHVLDTTRGVPIGGLPVSLYKLMDGRWTFLNESNTLANGRCNDLVDSKANLPAGRYKLHFDVDKYFTLRRIETMYPFIEIVFDVKNPSGNYHIPVLLSPFGYTTYRGSDR